jgi:MSHA pilin protein MshD
MLFKPPKIATPYTKRVYGFTLIELIIGIVVLSISLAIISTLIVPAEEKSADQILQVKAAELAQSFLNDISSRAFDENSDMAGGLVRCGEPVGLNACTDANKLGPEDGNGGRDDKGETERGLFNDVDDFDYYANKFTANDEGLAEGYNNFTIDVRVVYDGLSLGLPTIFEAKKITVSVTTPLGTKIQFATHKANF